MKRISLVFLILLGFCFPQFTKFTHPNLKADYIRAFSRSDTIILIGTTEGLFFKNKDTGKVNKVFSLPPIYIRSIYTAPNNILWIASYDGVYKLDINNSFKLLKWYTKNQKISTDGLKSSPGLSSDDVSCIAGNESTIFVGTDKWGINTIDVASGLINKKKITSIDGIPSDQINDICVTPAMVIVSTSKGIAYKGRWSSMWFSVDDEKSPAYQIPVEQTVYLNNRLFMATLANGIMEISLDSIDEVVVYNLQNKKIPSDEIVGLAVDGEFLWASLFSGQIIRYDLNNLQWKTYTISDLDDNTLDKVFIDGNQVYVGSDGKGIFTYNKKEPEVAFFPEVSFDGKKMNIYGSVVSKKSIKPVKLSDVRYRDADTGADFTSKGVTIHLQQQENIYHNKIASIDFSKLKLFPKIWNYEVRFKVVDQNGYKNEASAVFLYDALKPRLSLVQFANDSIQYTSKNIFIIDGKVQDNKLKKFYYIKSGIKKEISIDSLGNFQLKIRNLSIGNNDLKFIAVDFCQNITEKGVTIIYDKVAPVIKPVPSEMTVSDDDRKITFSYIEDNLMKATLFSEGIKIGLDMDIDRTMKKISAEVPIGDDIKTMKIRLYDLAKNITEYKFIVRKDDNKPIIFVKDNYTEIETDQDIFSLVGQVRSREAVKVTITKGTNQIIVKSGVYKRPKTGFSAKLPVLQRLTIFTIRADISDPASSNYGLYSEKMITVIGKQFQEDGTTKENTVTQEESDQIALLKAEIARLKKTGGRVVKVSSGISPFYGNTPAIKLVKFKNLSLDSISEKYVGSKNYSEIIDILNSKISITDLKSQKSIAVPNRAMSELLIQYNNRSLTELVKLLSYLLFIHKNKSARQVMQELANRFDEKLDMKLKKNSIILSNPSFIAKKNSENSKVNAQNNREFKVIILKILPGNTISVSFI